MNILNINKVIENMDIDFYINRIAYMLNTTSDEILKRYEKGYIANLIANMILNRNLDEDVDLFNHPENYFTNPYELTNAEEAAKLIYKFCTNKDAYIYIYADYDADGLTSGYTAYNALFDVSNCAGIDVHFPERSEGYGLSMEFCKEIVEKHKDNPSNVLVMTVDNGITKIDEVKYLKDNGIEVLITDHHTSKEEVPNCLIVNPHNNTIQQEDTFKHLCGCGVAFKVLFILQDMFDNNQMYKYLPYLCISTISDVMPLSKENMAIIQYGLSAFNSDDCPPAIRVLANKESIDIITAETIGWIIAPMLNACGRLGQINYAVDFLFEQDSSYVEDIVNKVYSINDKRKRMTKNAKNQLDGYNTDDNVFIMNSSKFEAGILGIIAGEAVKRFNKPAIVVTPSKEKELHGSIRSIPGLNIIPILQQLKDQNLITEFGGHPEAAGIFFNQDNIPAIKEVFNKVISIEEPSDEQQVETKEFTVDNFIELDDINNIILAASTIIPTDGKTYGYPIFEVLNCELKDFKCYPSGYLELTVKQNNYFVDMPCMGLSEKFLNEILPSLDQKDDKKIHVIGTITKHFKNKKYTLNVKDIKVS